MTYQVWGCWDYICTGIQELIKKCMHFTRTNIKITNLLKKMTIHFVVVNVIKSREEVKEYFLQKSAMHLFFLIQTNYWIKGRSPLPHGRLGDSPCNQHPSQDSDISPPHHIYGIFRKNVPR